MAKILCIGDVMGRPGRAGLAKILPEWREQYRPEAVIANVENLAHGKGVTLGTMAELAALGIDVFSSGNHVFDKTGQAEACFDRYPNLIRPANYPSSYPGSGYYRFAIADQQVLVVNLGGQVFFEKQFTGPIDNPFTVLDDILNRESQKGDIIIIDFHAEATSEKIALARYVEGRATFAYGTHTHVPTADPTIFPKGTAYVTDIGMTGPQQSVIGVKIENALAAFLGHDRFRMEVAEAGIVQATAMLLETKHNQPISLTRISDLINL